MGGRTRAKAAGLRAPGEAPARPLPELGGARRRGEGRKGRGPGRAPEGQGRACLHAPRRVPAGAGSRGKGMAWAEEDAVANGKPARLHLSGTSRQAAAHTQAHAFTHAQTPRHAHIPRHTHAHTPQVCTASLHQWPPEPFSPVRAARGCDLEGGGGRDDPTQDCHR